MRPEQSSEVAACHDMQGLRQKKLLTTTTSSSILELNKQRNQYTINDQVVDPSLSRQHTAPCASPEAHPNCRLEGCTRPQCLSNVQSSSRQTYELSPYCCEWGYNVLDQSLVCISETENY